MTDSSSSSVFWQPTVTETVLSVEEVYKQLEGCGKAYKTLDELKALAIKDGPEMVLLQHAPEVREDKKEFATDADAVQFIRENVEGRSWGALEINSKTGLPVFYVWQPAAPSKLLPADHKVSQRFEAELKAMLSVRARGKIWCAVHHASSYHGTQLPLEATFKTQGQYDSRKIVFPWFWHAVVTELAEPLLKMMEKRGGEMRLLCGVHVDSATKGLSFAINVHGGDKKV